MKNNKPVKSEKTQEVAALSQAMKSASSVIFVDYTTLTMKEGQALKKKLAEGQGQMLVAKNTLLRIAAREANLPEEALSETVLAGQTAMVLAQQDPVAPLQILGKFMSETDKTKWKAGVVEGSFQDAQGLARISKLPSKEQLVAQVVGGISAPLYGLVATLNGNIQKLVYVLDARRSSMNA